MSDTLMASMETTCKTTRMYKIYLIRPLDKVFVYYLNGVTKTFTLDEARSQLKQSTNAATTGMLEEVISMFKM